VLGRREATSNSPAQTGQNSAPVVGADYRLDSIFFFQATRTFFPTFFLRRRMGKTARRWRGFDEDGSLAPYSASKKKKPLFLGFQSPVLQGAALIMPEYRRLSLATTPNKRRLFFFAKINHSLDGFKTRRALTASGGG